MEKKSWKKNLILDSLFACWWVCSIICGDFPVVGHALEKRLSSTNKAVIDGKKLFPWLMLLLSPEEWSPPRNVK